MRKNYLLLSLLAVAMEAGAEQRSVEEARDIASAKMVSIGMAGDATIVDGAAGAKYAGDGSAFVPYYVFTGDEGKGFVIVAGESAMPDIVGYSASGVYDEETMPDGLAYFLEAYADMAASASSGDNRAISRIMAARALRQSSVTAVSPLLGDIEWAQLTPYNNLCPTKDGSHTAAGCVATAMAQIMKYHEWPDELQANIPSYQYTYEGETVTIDAISAGYEYDWDNMLSSYTGSYTDEEADAVASLVYHCGAATGTLYTLNSSSAPDPIDELYTYFGYDADVMQWLLAVSYNLSDWNDIIQSELANGRPVYYSGSSSSGSGHAFVCDGVDSEGLYHINWGWAGYENGYFDITILNPEKGGTGSGSDADGYNRSCAMIVGIMPDNGISDDKLYHQPSVEVMSLENFSITDDSRSSSSSTFSISSTYNLSNYTEEDFSGLVGMGILQSDGSVEYIGGSTTKTLAARDGLSVTYYSLDFSFSYAFPTGESILVAVYSSDGGSTWNICGSAEHNAVIVSATSSSLSQVDRTVSVSLEAEEELLASASNQLKLTATNSLGVEFMGDLYIYESSSNSQPSNYVDDVYLRIPSGESAYAYVSLDVDEAGSIYVWVEDEFGNVLVDGEIFTVSANEEPEMVISSYTTNASDTDYDEEHFYYATYLCKVPKIYSDTLFITWNIDNTGGTYRGYLETEDLEMDETGSSYTTSTVRATRVTIPASSSYEYRDTLLRSQFNTQRVYCRLVDEGSYMSGIAGYTQLYLASSNMYVPLTSREVVAYFADTDEWDTGIDDVTTNSGFAITGGEGCISIYADEPATVRIYTTGGQMVRVVSVDAGASVSVSVPAGIYIVEGKKIIVR